jgi:hypothetical protein
MSAQNPFSGPVRRRGMTQRRLSRRDAFRLGALAAAGAGLAA